MGQERSLTQECFWSDSKLEAVQDFPGGPVLRNPPFNAGGAGSIPGWGTKIPYAEGKLTSCASATESANCNERFPKIQRRSCLLQLGPRWPKKKKKKIEASRVSEVKGRVLKTCLPILQKRKRHRRAKSHCLNCWFQILEASALCSGYRCRDAAACLCFSICLVGVKALSISV